MKQGFDSNDKNQETAEKRLAALIKQAGDEARARKREAMALHFKKLQTVIGENDGDSFFVESDGKTFHVRLYFVDCPETSTSSMSDARRIREQTR